MYESNVFVYPHSTMWALVPLWISHVWHLSVWLVLSCLISQRLEKCLTNKRRCMLHDQILIWYTQFGASDHTCMFSRHTALVIPVSFTQRYPADSQPVYATGVMAKKLLFSITCMILHPDLLLVLCQSISRSVLGQPVFHD